MTATLTRPEGQERAVPSALARRPSGWGWRTFIAVSIVLIALLALIPIGYLLWGTFVTDDGEFTGNGFVRAYVDAPDAGSMIANSFTFAIGSTVLAMVIGTGLAFLYARTDVPFKGLLFTISVLPMAVSPLLYATSWIFLASPETGVFNALTDTLLGVRPLNIYSMPGMIWVQGTHLSPLAFLFMSAAFASMDPSLEESAMMSGAKRARVFRRITAPLLLASMAASCLLIFVQSLESFEVPAILGLRNQQYVFTSQLYHVLNTFPADYNAAGALSLGILVIALVAFWGSTRITRKRSSATVTGKNFRPNVIELGKLRAVMAAVVVVYFLLIVVLPTLVMLYASFLPYYQSPSSAAFATFTAGNYTEVFQSPMVLSALQNTLVLAVVAAVVVMVLTVAAGWFTTKAPRRLAQGVDMLTFIPIIVPGIVLAVALSFVFLRVPLPIYGTLTIIGLAFVIKYIPFGMRYTTAALGQVSNELQESAEVSGATQFGVMRRVILPLIKNGLLAGLILIFMMSFREVSAAVLLYTPGNEVLSIVMWAQVQEGQFGPLSALGSLMTVFLGFIVFLGYRTSKNFGMQ